MSVDDFTYNIPGHIKTPQGELQNTKLWMCATTPSSLAEGLIWYDSVNHLPKYSDGTAAVDFGKNYTSGTGISISSGNVISVASTVLMNTATGSDALTLLGTATTQSNSINIGTDSYATANHCVVLGYGAVASNVYSTALGDGAFANSNYSIQLGYGTNSTANSLSVGFYNNSTTHYNWTLLDGTTGLIPDARLSSNIARTSQIPTSASDINALPNTTKYGAAISMSLNSSTYVLSVGLLDQDGNALGTAQTVDFPVESLVMSVAWNSTTNSIDITLKNGTTTSIPATSITNGLQPTIDSSHKLSSDLVDDTNKTHKFATAAQLTQIGTNQTNIGTINTTLSGYGNIVTHNTSEFATASQGTKADSAVQKYAVDNTAITVSNGGGSMEITHGLGTDDVSVTVIEKSTHKVIFPVWTSNSGKVTVNFLSSSNISAGTYRIIIMG